MLDLGRPDTVVSTLGNTAVLHRQNLHDPVALAQLCGIFRHGFSRLGRRARRIDAKARIDAQTEQLAMVIRVVLARNAGGFVEIDVGERDGPMLDAGFEIRHAREHGHRKQALNRCHLDIWPQSREQSAMGAGD